MKIENLDQRDDLLADPEQLKEEIDLYFENISREKLKKDLEEAGFVVEDLKTFDFEECLSDIKIKMSNNQNNYIITQASKEYDDDEKDLRDAA